jgi:hypothetical protein
MNYLEANCPGNNIDLSFFRYKYRKFKINYPDTLYYQDSFNLQISSHSVFEI